jgi:hypothetical protein
MHFFLYQVGTVNPKIFYALIFMAFYLVIVGYVKKITKSNLLGLLAGTLTILTPSIWWNSILGVTNITFMAYISLAILYLFDPSEKDFTTGQIFLGAMLLGFSIWTRIEPFWMVPALLVFIRCLSKWKIKALILFFVFVIPMSYLWPSSVITAPSVTVRTPVNAISAELYHMQRITNTNITQAVGYFSGSLYDSWGLILPLFFAVFALEVVFFKKSFPWIQITAIALTLAIIYGVISFSNWYVRWKGLSSSVYRMAIITVPLYWVSIVNSKIWKKFGRFVGIF